MSSDARTHGASGEAGDTKKGYRKLAVYPSYPTGACKLGFGRKGNKRGMGEEP